MSALSLPWPSCNSSRFLTLQVFIEALSCKRAKFWTRANWYQCWAGEAFGGARIPVHGSTFHILCDQQGGRYTISSLWNIIIVTAIGIVLHIIMVFTNNNPAQPLWSLGASTGKNDRSGSKQVFGTLCKSGWAARLTSPSPSSSKWLANILIFCHESTHLDIMIFINLHHETIRHHDNYHIHCSAPLAARLANIPMFWYEFTHLLDERVVAQDPGPRCDRSLW